ncbi:MAG TPA: hypothetical protein VF733_04515 [Candidatus Saccharimonadales bacterium]
MSKGEASSWAARFRLPRVLTRQDVLAEIDRGVQAMKYSPHIPLDRVAECGLSGVLIGPAGDDDAELVQDVIFATDPSRRLGERDAGECDNHAIRIAEVNGWTEVDNPEELAADESEVAFAGSVRVIMGRNKDQYGGTSAFTLAEARALLPTTTLFNTSGGYLFSDRPGWDAPYGEPAIIAVTTAEHYDAQMEQELFLLAKGLNDQHRFVLETPWGAEVFEINSPDKRT